MSEAVMALVPSELSAENSDVASSSVPPLAVT